MLLEESLADGGNLRERKQSKEYFAEKSQEVWKTCESSVEEDLH